MRRGSRSISRPPSYQCELPIDIVFSALPLVSLVLRGEYSSVISHHANLAQLVEHFIRNERVVGSNPIVGSCGRDKSPERGELVEPSKGRAP